jgi:hypothetical protein
MGVHHSRYGDTLYLKRSVKSDPPSSIRTEDVRKAGSALSAVSGCPSIVSSTYVSDIDSKPSKFRSSLLSLSTLLPFSPTLYVRILLVGIVQIVIEEDEANAEHGRAKKEIQRANSSSSCSSATGDQRNRTIMKRNSSVRTVGPLTPPLPHEEQRTSSCHDVISFFPKFDDAILIFFI